MQRLKEGDLVTFDTLKTFSSSGLCIARAASNNCIKVSEKINLDVYPSYNDFTGASHTLCPDETATVVTYVGRPWKIRKTDDFEEFDVYEVLVNDFVCQIFSGNLLLVEGQETND